MAICEHLRTMRARSASDASVLAAIDVATRSCFSRPEIADLTAISAISRFVVLTFSCAFSAAQMRNSVSLIAGESGGSGNVGDRAGYRDLDLFDQIGQFN